MAISFLILFEENKYFNKYLKNNNSQKNSKKSWFFQ